MSSFSELKIFSVIRFWEIISLGQKYLYQMAKVFQDIFLFANGNDRMTEIIHFPISRAAGRSSTDHATKAADKSRLKLHR
jgi:hypothetical protein